MHHAKLSIFKKTNKMQTILPNTSWINMKNTTDVSTTNRSMSIMSRESNIYKNVLAIGKNCIWILWGSVASKIRKVLLFFKYCCLFFSFQKVFSWPFYFLLQLLITNIYYSSFSHLIQTNNGNVGIKGFYSSKKVGLQWASTRWSLYEESNAYPTELAWYVLVRGDQLRWFN